MKYKVYLYSGSDSILKTSDSFFTDNFELMESKSEEPAQVLALNPDVVFLHGSDYEKFSSLLPAVDWKTSQIGFADCIIKNGKTYKQFNCVPETILKLLKVHMSKINSQQPVIIIGDYYFCYGTAVKLAKSGFVEIIVSLVENSDELAEQFEKKIKSYIFDLKIKMISINELTTSEQVASLMISNFEKEKNKDAYELLTYFNFLSEGAVLMDANSVKDGFLVEDARKAEIFVVDETEILRNKYEFLLEKLKNQSKV